MTEDTAVARVLVADDTPDIRALLRIVLSRQDDFVVVAEAADGREAVDMAAEHRPDLVLLDLAMPGLDGLEAIPGVRAAVPDCKIVVLSGYNAGHQAAAVLEAGADAYLEKGTPALKLVEELRRICGFRAVEPSPRPTAVRSSMSSEISVMTHEFMGPLAVIEGFASLLERRPDAFEPETVSEHAASIVRSAQLLRTLLQAVTDARRLEASELTITREDTDVVALMRAATEGHPVVIDAPASVAAFVDPVRIRQVVGHLVTNAVAFSPADASIDIGVSESVGWVRVTVRDYGPGVPAARKAELFRPFSRLGATGKGLGLGLYISRGIALAHGGDLSLVDTVDGPGATFVLRLPLR